MAKKVVVGVSGGIAAYKACALVREFIKRGDEVRVVMTKGATEFVGPMTFQALSDQPVGTEVLDQGFESEIGHIDLARWADVVVVAPATANVIARMAQGMADDLLTTVLLATRAPVVVAPAMNTQMWEHPRVQANLEVLRQTPRHRIVEPDAGELACKEVGAGRLPDAPVLVQEVDAACGESPMAGKQVMVTAGPTWEFIDPARFISNPSSGKMGHRVAAAAWEMGAEVTLVRGPVALDAPHGVSIVEVTEARQMEKAVAARVEAMDYVVMAAAVADWRPQQPNQHKKSKSEMSGTLELVRNPDILAGLGERFGPGGDEEGPMLIGFAAESEDLVERGRAKLERKNAHLIVANQIGGPTSTFGADRATIHVISREHVTEYPGDRKANLARAIWKEALRYERGEH